MNQEQRARSIRILEAFQEQYPDHYKFILPDVISRRFNSLYSIRADIEHMINAESELSQIMESEKQSSGQQSMQTVKTALWNSIVASYGKCFTANNHRRTKLEPSQCFKDKPDLKALHEKLMRIRHEFVSHRGDNEYDVSLVTLMYPKDETAEEQRPRVQVIGLREIWPRPDELAEYRSLFQALMNHVENRLSGEAERLSPALREYMEALPDDQRAKLLF